jgi:hypothetical protein
MYSRAAIYTILAVLERRLGKGRPRDGTVRCEEGWEVMGSLYVTQPPPDGNMANQRDILAYLSKALMGVRELSPFGARYLEISIAVLNDDIRAANEAADNSKTTAF